MEKYHRISYLPSIKLQECEKYQDRKIIKIITINWWLLFKQNKFIHRLVCQYFNANPNNYNLVDHSNGNKLDNRAENLRFCTSQQNNLNKKNKKIQQVFLKELHFSIEMGIGKHRQCYFTDEEEAARKYDMKAIELFGEFARTNFPRENYQQEEGQEEDQFQTGN